MKSDLVLIAQKFCNECFCNVTLDNQQFLNKVNELVTEIEPFEEKLILLNELIRLGKLFYHTDKKLKMDKETFDFRSLLTAN
jgi:hypothetical protein